MLQILTKAQIGTEGGWVDVYKGHKLVKSYRYSNLEHLQALLTQLTTVLGL